MSSDDNDQQNQAAAAAIQQGALDRTASSQDKLETEHTKAAKQFLDTKAAKHAVMHVKVYSPFKDYYDGQALSISAANATGPFDILPKHHNFISLLSPCELVIRDAQGDHRKIIISGGVMHVKADQVMVFLNI